MSKFLDELIKEKKQVLMSTSKGVVSCTILDYDDYFIKCDASVALNPIDTDTKTVMAYYPHSTINVINEDPETIFETIKEAQELQAKQTQQQSLKDKLRI